MANANVDGPPRGDVSLDLLSLPTRMHNWADAHGIDTLRALAWIPPEELLEQRNIGRRSIKQTRMVIEARLRARWEDLCRLAPAPPASDPRREAWEHQVRANGGDPDVPAEPDPEPPPLVGDVSVDAVPLPTRMLNWAHRRGIETLGALARIPPGDLIRERNLGRLSITKTRRVIEAHFGIRWGGQRSEPAPSPALAAQREADRLRREHDLLAASFLDSLRVLVAELPQRERVVLESCTGLVGPARRMAEVARRFSVDAPALYRWRRLAFARLQGENAWISGVRARVSAVLADGAVPLETLAADPWWAGFVALPDTLGWFGPRLVGELHLVEIEGSRYAARVSQDVLDDAWRTVRKASSQVPLPAPLAAFHALFDPWAPRLGPVLTAVLRDRIEALLLVEDWAGHDGADPRTPGAETRVLQIGLSQPEATLLILQGSPEPVSVAELDARLGHRVLPDEALLLGHGLVGLERHFPDFAGWTRRLVPAALRVMRRGPRGRQWAQHEVHGALREAQGLPEWLGPWHLGSVLRRSGTVRWVGQGRFTLPDAPEARERVGYVSELVRILRAARGPLSRHALQDALARKTSVREGTLNVYLGSAPFLRCGRSLYGLLERDLPGGPEAIARAIEHVVLLFARRGRGMSAAEVSTELCTLGEPYTKWTPEMCLAALGTDRRMIRTSGNAAVGLRTWGDTRVPTRRELLVECLDRGGGRAKISTVLRRIEAVYHTPVPRYGFPTLAAHCGAEVSGKWVVRKSETS